MKVGIVGLPNVGKTTIFNALTRSHAADDSYPFCTIEPNRGVVAVPDQRLERLAEMVSPDKIIPAQIEFLDVAGLVEGASHGEGLGNQFLSCIRETRAIAQVVRCFSGDEVACQTPSIEPRSELEIVAIELLLSDLQVVERALGRKSRGAKEIELLSRIRDGLAGGRALREIELSRDERRLIREFGFLSLKPMIVVANTGEGQSEVERAWLEEARSWADDKGAGSVTICGKLEKELAELPEQEAEAFLKEMNVSSRALPRFVRKCYELLGLITFFSFEGGIVQAWAVPGGTEAASAAGRIHTDMERGFIRAEVIGFEELVGLGGIAEARAKGLLRLEGRDYVVGDGDVIRFRFN